MSPRKLRFGIVGAGNITSLRHIPALKQLRGAEVVGIVDSDSDRAQRVAKRFGLRHWGTDLTAPWFDTVEAVTIGVPPQAHAAVARTALEAGKHVLLEKPMALYVEEGEEIVDRASRRRLVLAVVQNFQFARSALKLQALIAQGKLGEIRNILAFQTSTAERRLPVWYEELPMGLFYDEAPHLLYLLRAFGGEVEVESVRVVPSTCGRRTPAVVTAHFRAGPVPAILYNNFESPVSEWHFAVLGTRAVGIIDVFRDVLVALPNDGQHLAAQVLRSTWAGVSSHLWGVLTSGIASLRGRLLYGNEEVCRRFLAAVQTGVPPAGVSAEEGLAVLRLQHAILAAAGVEQAGGSARRGRREAPND